MIYKCLLFLGLMSIAIYVYAEKDDPIVDFYIEI